MKYISAVIFTPTLVSDVVICNEDVSDLNMQLIKEIPVYFAQMCQYQSEVTLPLGFSLL